mgnify:CR=1 FL=1
MCKNKYVLLVRMRGLANSFLPGGHIEMGESAPVALAREIQEELGQTCKVKSFFGAIENSWREGGTMHHEINLIFEADIPGLDPGVPVVSQEDHLEFFWVMPEDFENKNLLPIPARVFIKNWLAGDKSPWWGSSIE